MVWALRLALFLWFTRIRHRHIDKRYLQLSENWRISQALGYFLNFQLQGALIFIISTVFFFAAQVSITALTTVDYLGVVVVVVGIVGETLADWQLLQFKKNCKGRVCNQGLWHFSRHPNYFFEWLLWCGFSLFALQADYGYLGVISPAMLLFIFTRLTGPLTEEGSLRSRGQAYQEYQKRTNFFFPGWQKGP
jgi:steroid 5-alpha reductase family enzyme